MSEAIAQDLFYLHYIIPDNLDHIKNYIDKLIIKLNNPKTDPDQLSQIDKELLEIIIRRVL